MGTLTVTKTYSSGTALMESDLDNFRTGLLTLFNTDKLALANFSATLAILSSQFTGAALTATDAAYINFGTTDDGVLGLDTDKKWVFDTSTSTYELRFYVGTTNYMEIFTDKVYCPGDVNIDFNGGGGGGVLKALTYYKPVLVYDSISSVSIEGNSATTDNTTIYFPNFVASVTESSPAKYRYASISTTANGEGAADSGAARGGMRTGSVAANTWYYVYAAKVRSGTDYSATAHKFILVFDTTAPTAANGSTIDGYYGNGNWVYLGLIRYGFGASGSTTSIPKFVYSRKGWCTFYEKASTGACGLHLAYSSTDADNTATALYTIAAGTSGSVIPATIGHIRLGLFRERVSDWKIRETSTSTSDVVWAGGWQSDDGTLSHGFLVEIANVSGYSVYQGRKSSNAGTARAVCLLGFTDGYMVNKGLGHGI